ncbi:hypothetical protein ACWGI0_23150 [Streptomyces sp. NPDC054802]
MEEKFHNRTVRLPDGFTVSTLVTEKELEGTDEEFLTRNPKVLEIAERWAAEEEDAVHPQT